ncbi:MAG: hypothetical protein HC860_11470 [Alkalinema sp. RU_4_3]|nr:hypothetical protein [Alkalinema sp. RU_4_3]
MNTQLVDSIVRAIDDLSPEEQVLVRDRLGPASPEVELLQKIRQGIPIALQSRYDEMRRRLQADLLLPEEHQEFLELTAQIEQADSDRLAHLVALSKLRQVSLPQLMQQLNLQTPPVYV